MGRGKRDYHTKAVIIFGGCVGALSSVGPCSQDSSTGLHRASAKIMKHQFARKTAILALRRSSRVTYALASHLTSAIALVLSQLVAFHFSVPPQLFMTRLSQAVI